MTADNLQTSLHIIYQERPDLILLDLHLKDSNGLEILSNIRKEKIDAEVILITAAKELDIVKQGLHLGILDYLIKPFSFERFKKSIDLYQQKNQHLEENNTLLSQEGIDSLFYHNTSVSDKDALTLEKGLTQQTLDRLVTNMRQLPEPFTIQQLADISNLSHVSVRKYVMFLEKNHFLRSDMAYLKKGRPYQTFYFS